MKNRTEESLRSEFYALSPEDWFDLLFGEADDIDCQIQVDNVQEDYKNGNLYDQLYNEEINSYLDIYCWQKLERIYTMDFSYLDTHSFYFDNTESERHNLVSAWFNSLSKDDFDLTLSEYGPSEIFLPRIKNLFFHSK